MSLPTRSSPAFPPRSSARTSRPKPPDDPGVHQSSAEVTSSPALYTRRGRGPSDLSASAGDAPPGGVFSVEADRVGELNADEDAVLVDVVAGEVGALVEERVRADERDAAGDPAVGAKVGGDGSQPSTAAIAHLLISDRVARRELQAQPLLARRDLQRRKDRLVIRHADRIRHD